MNKFICSGLFSIYIFSTITEKLDFNRFLYFQEDDILITFYRNMIKSVPFTDLIGTLTILSIDIFLKIIKASDLTMHTVMKTLRETLDVIKCSLSSASFTLSIKNTIHFKSLISSVVWPKVAKVTTYPNHCVLVTLILEAYISCINSSNYPNIKVLQQQFSGNIEHSRFYHGILLPLERTSTFNKYIHSRQESKNQNKILSIVVLSCPIPQELESFEGETFKLINIEDGLEDIFVKQSIQVLEDEVKNIDVLCSQKVIHHRIKAFLQSRGVLVLDRLSIMYAENIATLCETTLSASIARCERGRVKDISLVKFGRRNYLHFHPVEQSHFGTITLFSLVGKFTFALF